MNGAVAVAATSAACVLTIGGANAQASVAVSRSPTLAKHSVVSGLARVSRVRAFKELPIHAKVPTSTVGQ
jgi:hypothetical protein